MHREPRQERVRGDRDREQHVAGSRFRQSQRALFASASGNA
jgi:hypothetical protein